MSMIRCEGHSGLCIDLIDSDADPDCFVEVGNMRGMDRTLVLCHACRDHRQSQPTEPPDREFSPSQQAIIDAHEADTDPDFDPTDAELEAAGAGGMK